MKTNNGVLVLSDLLEGSNDPNRAESIRRRDASLALAGSWTIHKPILIACLAAMRPQGPVAGSSLTPGVAKSNRTHDDCGRALIGHAEAVLDDPFASEAAKVAATIVLTEVLTGRNQLVLSHPDEIANARARKPRIEKHAASLRLIPAADGRTGLDLANAMTQAAEERAGLMGDRATQPADPTMESTAWAKALSARSAVPFTIPCFALISATFAALTSSVSVGTCAFTRV